MSIDKIVNFEGKRNCSITLLLKVNDRSSSTLDQIERKISSIKHENKRKQLKNVIYRIKNETKDLYNNYDFKERGLIICCGLKNSDESTEYFELNPSKIIKENEYYYDYKFNIDKIFEKIYDTIEYVDCDIKELNKLREKELIIYEKEIQDYIEMNAISFLFYFSNDDLTVELCNLSKEYNFKIKIIKCLPYQKKELINTYGNFIGILYPYIKKFNENF